MKLLLDSGAILNSNFPDTFKLMEFIKILLDNNKTNNIILLSNSFSFFKEQLFNYLTKFSFPYYYDKKITKYFLSNSKNFKMLNIWIDNDIDNVNNEIKKLKEIMIKNNKNIKKDKIKFNWSSQFFQFAYPIMLTCSYNKDIKVIEYLLKKGIDINTIDKFGTTPLIIATVNNPDYHILEFLLKNGANVNHIDYSYKTALFYAISFKKDKIFIDTLIKYGAYINIKEISTGMTPLMYAVLNNCQYEIIHTLLQAGADPDIISNNGLKAIDFAKVNKNFYKNKAYLILKEKTK